MYPSQLGPLHDVHAFGIGSAPGLTATGNDQASALPVGPGCYCEFTTVGSGTGAILTAASLPARFVIANASATYDLLLYPPVGGSLNSASVNTPYAVGPGDVAVCYPRDGILNWYVTGASAG